MTIKIEANDFEIGRFDVTAYKKRTQRVKDFKVKKKVEAAEKRKGK